MRKVIDFIDSDLNKYSEIYYKITKAKEKQNEFEDFSVENNDSINMKKYLSHTKTIKEYVDLLEQSKQKLLQKTIRNFFKLNDEKTMSDLISFKNVNNICFSRINKCLNCKCFDCTRKCNYYSCVSCLSEGQVSNCNDEYNIFTFSNKIIELHNDNSNENMKFNTLAIITLKDSKRYIILQNINDIDDNYILYYITTTSGEEYGEITNPEEIDKIANIALKENININ